MTRNESIDVVKGFLIITVIIGHILLGTLDDNVLRYFIYSFHMPVFLFISGYLLNLKKVLESSPRKLLSIYWKRMILQWSIALIIYSFCISIEFFSIQKFFSQLFTPYYHLWYVPTLFSFIIITKILRYIKEDIVFFIFSLSIGLLFNNINLQISIGELRLNFFIFFLIGMLARRLKLKIDDIRMSGGIIVINCLLFIALFIYGIPQEYYIQYLRLPCMLSLCILAILPIITKKKLQSAPLSAIGRHSLEIYLWHVLPIVLLKHYLINDTRLYYISSFVIFAIFYIAMWKKEKMKMGG